MKAHIARMPRVVLAWGLQTGSTASVALEKAAACLNMTVKPVACSDLTSTVACLCGLPQARSGGQVVFNDSAFPPAAVFCGLSDGELDQMLAALKGSDIPLKAIVTPTNRDWSLGALLTELCNERNAIAAQNMAARNQS